MWFIIPVKEYHANGRDKNRQLFSNLIASGQHPIGLMAYSDITPVGWCAVGPRSRYVRGIKTPTFKGRDPAEDASVWLVPCFFVRQGYREQGVARALLEEAVSLAAASGASAIEGFPLAGTNRRSGADTQVGVEGLFSSCGFSTIRRPTDNRAVMRRELQFVSPSDQSRPNKALNR